MTFEEQLLDSVTVLREDTRDLYERMCTCLGSRVVQIIVDDEPVTLDAASGALTLSEREPVVRATASREAILEVLDGKRTLEEAVLAERIELFGRVDDLLAFHAALQSYVHGAVRSPRFPRLLRRFRSQGGTDRA